MEYVPFLIATATATIPIQRTPLFFIYSCFETLCHYLLLDKLESVFVHRMEQHEWLVTIDAEDYVWRISTI